VYQANFSLTVSLACLGGQGARQPLLAVSLEGATDMAWGSDPVVDGTGWNWPTTKALQGYDLSALRIVISRRVWLQPLVASAHLLWYKDDGTDQERYSEQLGVPMQLDLRGLVVLQVVSLCFIRFYGACPTGVSVTTVCDPLKHVMSWHRSRNRVCIDCSQGWAE